MPRNAYVETVLCGGCAGMLSNTITHPFDTVKALIQYQVGRKNTKELLVFMKNTLKNEGVVPFYRGFVIVALSALPSTAVYFIGLEEGRRILPGRDESMLKQCSAAVFGQFLSSFISTPRDVIKQRLQVQRLQNLDGQYTGAWHAFKSILKTDGISGLFRGYWQTLFLWSIYGGLYLAVYTKAKQWMRNIAGYQPQQNLPMQLLLPCAVSSAAISAAITNPLDVIKLHYQVREKQDSFWNIFTHVTRVHGARAWLRGIIARVLYISPRTAIAFTTYESIKAFLDA